MEAKALGKYLRNSHRKMKIIADEVRGMPVNAALNKLHFMPQSAARQVEIVLQSAVHNFMYKHEDAPFNEEEIYIREIFVNQAPMFKRIQPVSRGRAHRIHKRNSHLTVVVGVDTNESEELDV